MQLAKRGYREGVSFPLFHAFFGPAFSQTTEYRLGSEGLLGISVFEVPELNRSVRVDSSEHISLP